MSGGRPKEQCAAVKCFTEAVPHLECLVSHWTGSLPFMPILRDRRCCRSGWAAAHIVAIVRSATGFRHHACTAAVDLLARPAASYIPALLSAAASPSLRRTRKRGARAV